MKIGIIGGGASGVIAAIKAKDKGADVVIFEKEDRILKKLLLTGNGKCNLSHEGISVSDYHAQNEDDREKISKILSVFNDKIRDDLFDKLDLCTVSEDGYIYPVTHSSAGVVNTFLRELKKRDIRINTGFNVTKIKKSGSGWLIFDNKKEEYLDRIIISCGGASYVKTGSDGSMIRILKELGVKCNDLYPALTALKGSFFENEKLSLILSGLREYGKIYDEDDGLLSCGNIQFTDYGLSGIAIYDISHLYVTGEKKRLYFSLFDDKDKAYSLLCDCIKDNGMLSFHEAFCGLIHKKWIDFYLKALDIKSGEKVSDISKDKINKMAGYLNRLPFDVNGYKGFEHAQVTGGGICLSEIGDDMSLRNFPGIYVTGEMLDVFGKCGGYNLHFAFATGLIAGEAVLS